MQDHPKLKIIWYFLRHHKTYILLLLLVSLLIGAFGALNVSLVYTILNWGLGVNQEQANILGRFSGFIISGMPIEDNFIAACALFLIVATLFCIFMFIEVVLKAIFVVKISMSVKMQIFRKYVDADYRYFLEHKQGDLVYRASQAPDVLASLYFAIATIISHFIFSASLLWAIFTISPKLTPILIGLGFVYYSFTQYIGYKHLYFFGKETTRAGQDYNVVLNEFITGIRTIRINGFESGWIQKAKEVLRRRYYYHKKTKLWEGFPDVLLRWVFYSCMAIVAIVIRWRYPDSFVSIMPLFGAIAFAVLNLVPKLSDLGLYKMRLLTALPQVELIYKTLNENVDRIIGGNKKFENLEDAIKFENVNFSHKQRSLLLKGISMTFEKGKLTAIVGESGSGKSTIAHLLLRLFNPDKGNIIINGEDLQEYSVASWLNKVGFVDQDIFIYNASIKENIVFGLEKWSEEELIASAKIANIHDFVMNLPNTYDTLVGDRGVMLSGGEKQRVAIARAVLRDPRIMIFDEATASLDNVSEALVQEAIDNTLKGRTVIVIAHRLSTIQNADKIIVIDEGEVIEEGRHQELLEKRGVYRSLYNNIDKDSKGIGDSVVTAV